MGNYITCSCHSPVSYKVSSIFIKIWDKTEADPASDVIRVIVAYESSVSICVTPFPGVATGYAIKHDEILLTMVFGMHSLPNLMVWTSAMTWELCGKISCL